METSMLPARIADKIDVGDCWYWTAHIDSKGYGRIWWERTTARAHRLVYSLLVGPVPEGLHLDHLCRVRHCVNPDHLEVVTPGDNIRRGRTGYRKIYA